MRERTAFWSTLPGILTGLAALIGSLVAMLAALQPFGWFSRAQTSPATIGQAGADTGVPQGVPAVPATVVVQPGVSGAQTDHTQKTRTAPPSSSGNPQPTQQSPDVRADQAQRDPPARPTSPNENLTGTAPGTRFNPPFAWVLDRSQTLKIISADGSTREQIARVNIDLAAGGRRVLSASHDGRFALVVNAYDAVDRLARYNMDGSLAWSLKSGSYTAVCTATTGHSYAVKQGPNRSNRDSVLRLNSETGAIEKEVELLDSYFDIVVDVQNENVWVAGRAISRLDLDLNMKWTGDPIDGLAVSVDYAPDGTLMVAERDVSQGGGKDRLLRIAPDGKVQNSFPLQMWPSCVTVDRGFWDVWVVGFRADSVVRYNPKDPSWDRPRTYDLGKAYFAAAGRGTVWLAGKDTIRIASRDGAVVKELSGFRTDAACMAVIQPGR